MSSPDRSPPDASAEESPPGAPVENREPSPTVDNIPENLPVQENAPWGRDPAEQPESADPSPVVSSNPSISADFSEEPIPGLNFSRELSHQDSLSSLPSLPTGEEMPSSSNNPANAPQQEDDDDDDVILVHQRCDEPPRRIREPPPEPAPSANTLRFRIDLSGEYHLVDPNEGESTEGTVEETPQHAVVQEHEESPGSEGLDEELEEDSPDGSPPPTDSNADGNESSAAEEEGADAPLAMHRKRPRHDEDKGRPPA